MKDVLLVVALIGILIYGYFLMGKLDKILETKRYTDKTENSDSDNDGEPASCVMLTDDLTDEEIVDELKRFRKKHEKTRVIFYEETDENLTEKKEKKNNIGE